MYEYDVVVIGGGSAGLVACKLANGLGKKTALVERRKIGGDCTWFGCVPSKALIKAANVANYTRRLAEFGLESNGDVAVSGKKVMRHVRDVVQTDAAGHTAEDVEAEGIKVFVGECRFIDSHHVSTGGVTVSSSKFIVCTGSHPFVPEIHGLGEVDYLTNETIFSLDELPDSMIVLGGGPIGAEMCCALNRLGVKVTVVEKGERILPKEDRDVAQRLMEYLNAEGVEFLTGYRAVEVERRGDGVMLSVRDVLGQVRNIEADALLVAVGRRPNVEGLDLKDAGVAYDGKGITVDRYLRTSAKNIYAAGDVIGGYLFTHVAEYEAIVATSNACLPIKRRARYDSVPWCTFTDPEVARVGMGEEEARAKYGAKLRVYRMEHKDVDRAKTDVATRGMTKVLCDRRGKILGIHVVGHGAAEVMHEGQLARSIGLKFSRIAGVIHAYPSFSDAIRQPAKRCYVDMLQSNPFLRAARVFTARKNRGRVIAVAAVVAVLVILTVLFGDKLGLGSMQEHMDSIKGYATAHYGLSLLVFVLLYVVVVAFNVPGAVPLTLVGGFLYGTILGAVYVNIGATLGAIGAFAFARYIAGDSIQKKYGEKLARFNEELDRNGAGYLLFLRFIPLFPFFLINLVAGLTKLRLWTFVWTTSVGILPGSLVYANIGKQIGSLESTEGLLKFRFWGAFVLLGVFAVAPIVYKKVKAYKEVKGI